MASGLDPLKPRCWMLGVKPPAASTAVVETVTSGFGRSWAVMRASGPAWAPLSNWIFNKLLPPEVSCIGHCVVSKPLLANDVSQAGEGLFSGLVNLALKMFLPLVSFSVTDVGPHSKFAISCREVNPRPRTWTSLCKEFFSAGIEHSPCCPVLQRQHYNA